jgi:glyoxylase-like metal-dependent hydrolase (beta-lactamase superfamily II)
MSKAAYFKVAPGVWGMKIIFVNIYMVASDDHWVLIDTGLKGFAGRIRQMADELFGGVPPEAILLTHGHFDHRGAAEDLLKTWQVPIYAHTMELPYLTGQSAYPPPDPTTGGGLMSLSSFLYPKMPIDLRPYVRILKPGKAPHLPEWDVIYTPGHSPGHVSFYRAADGLLIAGDAFVTTRQESAIATLFSLPILSGPPKYFTYDWNVARDSVNKLQDLMPKIAATGHGMPMKGEALSKGLKQLTLNFNQAAKPHRGRYIAMPAIVDAKGVRFVPPAPLKPLAFVMVGALALIGFGLLKRVVKSHN